MNQAPILFDDFEVGSEMGTSTEVLSEDQLTQWATLYPWDAAHGDAAPSGIATVLMMRAYLAVVSPRPPGNLHVRQQMNLHAPIAKTGAVSTTISCKSKELKAGRRKLELWAEGRSAEGHALYDGTITLYWAA